MNSVERRVRALDAKGEFAAVDAIAEDVHRCILRLRNLDARCFAQAHDVIRAAVAGAAVNPVSDDLDCCSLRDVDTGSDAALRAQSDTELAAPSVHDAVAK